MLWLLQEYGATLPSLEFPTLKRNTPAQTEPRRGTPLWIFYSSEWRDLTCGSQVRRGRWVAVEIRGQRHLDRTRTRPFYSFLEKDDVIACAALATYAFKLAPLVETQYFSQI